MEFFSSSRLYPMASLAATFAIGYPVALEAKAEERDTRGFISTPMIVLLSGLTANCTLHPPAKLPMPFIILMARFRIHWYTVSGSVIAGATVIESPVCTPIGSKFSMEQITTMFPILSLSTSNSYSFHPMILCSISTSWVGEAWSPAISAFSKLSGPSTKPPPVPPSV